MRTVATVIVILGTLQLLPAPSVIAQGPPPPPAQQIPPELMLPPATKLEGFMAAVDSLMTTGYNEVGKDVSGIVALGPISVEAREMRDSHGNIARGMIVEVIESQTVRARSFVDADEIPALIKGLDAILEVVSNPTSFDYFEVRCVTRGELAVTAYSNFKGTIRYSVQAGRVVTSRVVLDTRQMQVLRGLFATALQKLNARAS
jgi:hypothetical protein